MNANATNAIPVTIVCLLASISQKNKHYVQLCPLFCNSGVLSVSVCGKCRNTEQLKSNS